LGARSPPTDRPQHVVRPRFLLQQPLPLLQLTQLSSVSRRCTRPAPGTDAGVAQPLGPCHLVGTEVLGNPYQRHSRFTRTRSTNHAVKELFLTERRHNNILPGHP
jgi:hypothetical protein